MRYLRTNTACRVTVGPFFDRTDGVTPETAITVTSCKLTLMVDDGNVPTLVLDTAPTASGGSNDMVHVTGDDAGFYDLELAAGNVNYLGRAMLAITDAATHCPVFHEFMILPAMIYDSLVLGTDRLDTNVTHIGDTSQTARDIGASVLLSSGTGTGQVTLTSGRVNADMTHIATAAVSTSSAQIGVNIVNAAGTAWNSGAIGASTLASDTIAAAKIATGAITNAKFAAGAIDAAAIANAAIDAATFAADVDAEVLAWIVDDATRIDASALNTLSSHDPGTTIGTSTLTQTQVTGGAYALNSASFAFASALDFSTTQKTSIGTAVAASAVASVTGNVGGNVAGSVGSVTGNVGGNVTGSVGNVLAISGSTTAADNLEVVFSTDFATNYNTTEDRWSVLTHKIYDNNDAVYVVPMIDMTSHGIIVGGLAGSAGSDIATDVWAKDPASLGVTTSAGSFAAMVDGIENALATVDGIVDDILVDTGTTIPSQISGLNNLSAAQVNAEVDTALADIHLDHLLAATYDPASKPGAADALLNELVESDSGVARFTTNALEQGPSGSGPSAADIADAVWDEAIAGHNGSGSTGEALAAAGGAGDPWITSLPGSYTAGQAGYILGTNLNATVSSRATQTSIDTVDGIVDAILVDTAEIGTAGAGLTALAQASLWTSTIAGRIDAAVSTRATPAQVATELATYDGPTNAEMVARTLAAASYATAAAQTTAQNDLDVLTGTDGVTLATSQPNYAPSTAAALASLVSTVGVAGAGLTAADDATLAAIAALNNVSTANVATACTTAFTTAVAEGYRATNATGSIRDILYEILAVLTQADISGVTMTTRKIDGTTAAKTYTLNDGTTPTGITEAT